MLEKPLSCEAIAIDAKAKTVDLKNVTTGEVTTESYDTLVLSPGAASVRPPLPGIDLPGIFQVRTVPDARTIKQWISGGTEFLAGMFNYSGIQMVKPQRRAVVVRGGFIGLETAENLVHADFEVTLIQKPPQLLSPLDSEVARLVESHVVRNGVDVVLNDKVAGFSQLDGGEIEVQTLTGNTYPADIVIMAIGVRPDTTLAKAAGLEIGERGGIRVDDHMRNSDPDIFAVGDAIEVKGWVTGERSLVALAGPANRQGRIAADVLCGDMPLRHWDDVDGAFLLDVRQPVELVVESVPGAVNIPLPKLRARLAELPKDREIAVICRSAQRGYYATRILLQNGFKARNISGGTLSRAMTFGGEA